MSVDKVLKWRNLKNWLLYLRVGKPTTKSCFYVVLFYSAVFLASTPGLRANDSAVAKKILIKDPAIKPRVDVLSQLEQIASVDRDKTDEPYFFFIPRREKTEEDRTIYIFDTKQNRLLAYPEEENLLKRLENGELEAEEWIVLPKNAKVYEMPSLQSRASNQTLGFPQVVKGNIFRQKDPEASCDWVEVTYRDRHYYIPSALLVKKTEWKKKESRNLPIGFERVDRHTALPLEYNPNDLMKINQKWNYHSKEYPKYLRAEVSQIIERMLQNAQEQGVHIRILSAFRSSEKQRYLYLRAIDKHGLSQKWVAKPGHSEHQLGTTVDLCGTDPKHLLSEHFDQTHEGRWLQQNASKYGFRQSYTQRNKHETGYMPEPWHFRYMGMLDSKNNEPAPIRH